MHPLIIETPTHGRVLVEEPADPSTRLLVAFHGYAQNAEDILADVRRIPGASGWRIAAVQALHRFYARDHQTVVASWMTREDRDLAIADNVEYVDRVIDELQASTLLVPRGAPPPLGRAPADRTALAWGPTPTPAAGADSISSREPRALSGLQALVFIGFSQGVAMAYRAALRGRHRADGIIALGGDIPPELKLPERHDWPAVLIGAGSTDQWYTADKLQTDAAFLASSDISHDIVRFDGGHEWSTAFLDAAGRWLGQVQHM